MRRLVCAATAFELEAWGVPGSDETLTVSGVGAPATFLGLIRPDPLPELILNIGIAGAYQGSGLSLGDVVAGVDEVWGDVGFELPDPPGFRPIREADFGAFYAEPLPLVRPERLCAGLPLGRGCTVNACTGTTATGRLREALFEAAFETMEGAAVAAVGRSWGVPVCEVRAISNIAAERDMQPANIRRALAALAAHLSRCRGRVQ